MNSIAEEFVLLTGFGPCPAAGAIKTRQIPLQLSAGQALLGIDAGGGRHLLLPIGDETVVEDRESRHVAVTERQLLAEDGKPLRFVDLSCEDHSLTRVFEQLVEDVVARIGAGVPANAVCQVALDDWRDLLRREHGPISREKALGLFGELIVLEMLATTDPLGAVRAWVGPQGRPQDFVHNGRALEVKTTSAVDSSTIRVSNVDQLDPNGLERLELVVVHVRDDTTGDALDDVVERLLKLGVPRRSLLASVEEAGYLFGAEAPYRFKVRSTRLWRVDYAFPSLRVEDIDTRRRPAITNITYDLALTTDPVSADEGAVAARLRGWTEA